jgi:hypothetical protein
VDFLQKVSNYAYLDTKNENMAMSRYHIETYKSMKGLEKDYTMYKQVTSIWGYAT